MLGRINNTAILLNAYYEALYGLLDSNKASITQKIERFLHQEIKNLNPPGFDDEKFSAYLDAAVAFLDERLESYNPVGIQYIFDRVSTEFARQLELQLNFYDSTEEFEKLKKAAAEKAFPNMTDSDLKRLSAELIAEFGAFPDNSIINAYKSAPTLNKLPDYILAKAIEDTIKTQ